MSDTRPHVIYIDDEPDNLITFIANFRTHYQIFTCESAADATAYLHNNEVKVIFSDQMMPDITGVEYFEAIRIDFPHIVRVLVTGYSDMSVVVDAINAGEIYRYVQKPWDMVEFKICIDNCIEKYDSEKQLRLKNLELEKALGELEKFVYSASHDLRAPITSIKGVLNIARLERNEEQTANYFGMIERSADKLNDFVSNIIHYYQNMKSDEMLEEINVDSLIEELLEKYKHYEGAENIVFDHQISKSSILKSDAHRIKMALGNILSNAIRFRDVNKPSAQISIKVVVNRDRTVFTISDNAIGISEELLPNVFNMFTKSDENNVGAGIGLYIAQEAISKLKGKIYVKSDLGVGSEFKVEVPNRG